MQVGPGLRYDIRRGPAGWSWKALRDDGVVAAHGRADSRALAAACVVYAIADTVSPPAPPAGARKKAA